jgi:hypothetical protein
MSLVILVGLGGAIFIYRVAYAERLNPWVWIALGLLLLALAVQYFPGALGLIGSQVLLFVIMTIYNMTRSRRW